MTGKDYFNKWREEYDSYSIEDQKRIINELEEKYPTQRQFSVSVIYIRKFLPKKPNQKILEIGGWKGHLASIILKENETIELWHNYDICSNAKDKSVCNDKRYECIIANDFVWNLDVFNEYDVCILSHVIEHIKESELRKLFTKLKNIKFIYIASPLKEKGSNWNNYMGTHILNCGWNSIRNMLKDYKETIINKDVRIYERD